MRCLFILAILITSMNAAAMSFLDQEHAKKLAKEAKKESGNPYQMTGYELFQSPIQPGGSYMLNVNLANLLRTVFPDCKLIKKIDQGLSLLEIYVNNLVETDEEVCKFRNDPAPNNNWESELRMMKERKRIEYRDYVMRTNIYALISTGRKGEPFLHEMQENDTTPKAFGE